MLSPTKSQGPQVTVLVLAALGVFLSGTLYFASAFHSVPPCIPGLSCETYTLAPPVKIGPLPVAAVGFANFLVLFVCASASFYLNGALKQRLRAIITIDLSIALLICIGLAFHMRIVEARNCLWCTATWLVVAVTLILNLTIQDGSKPVLRRGYVPFVALATASCLGLSLLYMDRNRVPSIIDEAALRQVSPAELLDSGTPVLGSAKAPRSVVIFSDLQCPFCIAASKRLSKLLPQGRFNLTMRHFPLDIHPLAMPAANLAEQLNRLGKFWTFVEYCYDKQPDKKEQILSEAIRTGLSPAEANRAFEVKAAYPGVKKDLSLGTKLGLRGVPTIIIIDPGSPPRLGSLDEL